MNPTPGNVLFDVWRLARAVGDTLDDALADVGMTGGDFGLYSLVLANPDASLSELAEASGIRLTTLSRRLRGLHRQGHLERRQDPSDRRVQRFRLSESGRAAHEACAPAFRAVLRDVEEELGPSRMTTRMALAELDRAVRTAGGAPPSRPPGVIVEDDVVSLQVDGPPLTSAQAQEARRFIEWLRHRDAAD